MLCPLRRFIVARGNSEGALAMIRKTMAWRKQYGADRLLEEEVPAELDSLCHLSGKDKEGHPVMFYMYEYSPQLVPFVLLRQSLLRTALASE